MLYKVVWLERPRIILYNNLCTVLYIFILLSGITGGHVVVFNSVYMIIEEDLIVVVDTATPWGPICDYMTWNLY